MVKVIQQFDQFGYEITLPDKPDLTSQAEIGRRQDRWASKVVRDITPESIYRNTQNTAPLPDQMALCDRIYTDAHFGAISGEAVAAVAGLEWDVQAFTDSPKAKPKSDDQKTADLIAEILYNVSSIEEYFEHIAWGDGFFPLSAAETIYDESYKPVRFELVDGVRLTIDRLNQLRLLTEENPREGELLKPATWTLHSLNRTNPRKTRFFKALAFYYMVARYAVIDWLSLSEKYGKPVPVAYYEDPNDKASIVEAVQMIGTEFAGVFPKSAKVELVTAFNATKSIQEGLAKFGQEQATKLVSGHTLIVDTESGSGTLAGEGAQRTNLKLLKARAKRVSASIRQGLIRPLVWLHRGPKYLDRLPVLQFKTDPPQDQDNKAQTYVHWNEALAPLNLAIDPEHIKEQSGVPNLVPRVALGAPVPGAPAGADPASTDTTTQPSATDPNAGIQTTVALTGIAINAIRDTLKDLAAGTIVKEAAIEIITGAGMARDQAEKMVEATIRGKPNVEAPQPPPASDQPPASQKTRASQKSEPKIRTLTDLIAAATMLGSKAAKDQTDQILELARESADAGHTLDEFQQRLFAMYEELDITKHAELTAQAMAVAKAMGVADEGERGGR